MTPVASQPWTAWLPHLAGLVGVAGWGLLPAAAWIDRRAEKPTDPGTYSLPALALALVATLVVGSLPLAWAVDRHGLGHLFVEFLPGHGTPAAGYGLHWWLAVFLRTPIALTPLLAGPVAMLLAGLAPFRGSTTDRLALALCVVTPPLLATLADGTPAAGSFVLHALAWFTAGRLGPASGAVLASLLMLDGPAGWVSAFVALESSGPVRSPRSLATAVAALLPVLALAQPLPPEPLGGALAWVAGPVVLALLGLRGRSKGLLDETDRRRLLGALVPLTALLAPLGVAAVTAPHALVAVLPPLALLAAPSLLSLGSRVATGITLGGLVLATALGHAQDPQTHLPRLLPLRLALASRQAGLHPDRTANQLRALGRAPSDLPRLVTIADLPNVGGRQSMRREPGPPCLVLGLFAPGDPLPEALPGTRLQAVAEAGGWHALLVEAEATGCASAR